MSAPFIKSDPRHPWLGEHKFPAEFDFSKWRSADGEQRCETWDEAEERSENWTRILDRGSPQARELAEEYMDCFGSHPCGICMEPSCARMFRINYVGRAAEALTEHFDPEDLTKVTLVHPSGRFDPGELHHASLDNIKAQVREKLIAAGLEDLVAVGGPDVSFNEDREKQWPPHWQIHMAFVAAGKSRDEIKSALAEVYKPTETIPRPVKAVPVTDLLGALSYTCKSVFFRRVSYIDHKDRRNTLPPRPLKPPQFEELAVFMSTQTLGSRIFLRGFRRRGHLLVREG